MEKEIRENNKYGSDMTRGDNKKETQQVRVELTAKIKQN